MESKEIRSKKVGDGKFDKTYEKLIKSDIQKPKYTHTDKRGVKWFKL